MESAAGTSAARASPPTTTRSQQLWHAAAEAIRALEGDSEPGVCTPVLAHLRRLQGLHERCCTCARLHGSPASRRPYECMPWQRIASRRCNSHTWAC